MFKEENHINYMPSVCHNSVKLMEEPKQDVSYIMYGL